MKKYIYNSNDHGREDSFEIVDSIPCAFQVWNIGRENFNFSGFIPLALVNKDYTVDLSSLKAYECPSEEIALKIIDKAKRQTVDAKEINKMLLDK